MLYAIFSDRDIQNKVSAEVPNKDLVSELNKHSDLLGYIEAENAQHAVRLYYEHIKHNSYDPLSSFCYFIGTILFITGISSILLAIKSYEDSYDLYLTTIHISMSEFETKLLVMSGVLFIINSLFVYIIGSFIQVVKNDIFHIKVK
ncbi:hypothetical protein [Photobacterium damselae]|uniref:hypothetical protein n=1 Tax=Photobacterium damselae TaxID=38293 RepID=UPI0035A8EE00